MDASAGRDRADEGDADLLAAVGRGDQDAYDTIFRRHYKAVVAYAMTVGGSAMFAEDAACEAMWLLWRKRRHVKLVDDSLLPWLLTTTKNTARNALRAHARDQRRQRDAAPAIALTTPEAELARREAVEVLNDCVARLSPLDRSVFIACIVDGGNYKEVAAATGLTVPAVGNRLSRTRKQLREQLTAASD